MDLPGVDLNALTALRRRLHANPELSGHEESTARTMGEFFAGCRPTEFLTGLGGHGLAAIFAGTEPGPVLLLRAELDALPLNETNDFPWCSTRPGVAHKCGHDGHLAILAGVAQGLACNPPARGKVILLCQPAEETGQGAALVAADLLARKLIPDWIFALHNLPGSPAQHILVREGAFAAGSAGLTVRLTGRTAHAAYPEQGRSPDQALAELVTGLAVLPIPLEEEGLLALVTVGHARLGEPAFGITPGEAEIMATLRSDDPVVLGELKTRAEDLVRQVAARHELAVDLAWSEEFPVTWNHPQASAAVAAAAARLNLHCSRPDESPFRWSEDCGHLLRLGKGAMFGLGAGVDHPPLHAGNFDFNEDLLLTGVAMLTELSQLVTQ